VRRTSRCSVTNEYPSEVAGRNEGQVAQERAAERGEKADQQGKSADHQGCATLSQGTRCETKPAHMFMPHGRRCREEPVSVTTARIRYRRAFIVE